MMNNPYLKIMRNGMIWLAVFAIPSGLAAQQHKTITVKDIYQDYRFYPSSIDGIRSMADGEHYTVLESGASIVRYDYATGQNREILFTSDRIPDKKENYLQDYELSSNKQKILLTTNVSKIYRHSFEAVYWVYDMNTRKATPLCDSGKQQLATFSPDGMKVAFVCKNNLYYKDLNTNAITQITFDGKFNNIINGAPDWVYEEEFGFSQAYCWSPDSKKLAFYRFDESRVKQFEMTVYNDLYPTTEKFKYPKAGEDNSIVTIKIYDLGTGNTLIANTGKETDQYIPRIRWTASDAYLCIIRLNRLQNKADVMLADSRTGDTKVILSEENSKFISGIDDDYILFTSDQKYFILLSERSGFLHYYRYTLDGKYVNAVTQGNFDVSGISGIDNAHGILYYTSNQSSVIQQDVYAVKFDGTGLRKLSSRDGENSVEFSSTFKYYINTWSDANTPPVYTLHKINGALIRVLEDNAGLKKDLEDYGFAKKEFIKIPVGENLVLHAYIIKPADFDSTKKYPLFISVYGGPESQDVKNAWDNGLSWEQMLVQQGYVVARIDNRGTDGRGEEFKKCTYLQLGKLEAEDQINAAKYLGSLSWIDETRIGIWGWSYGGYMTLLCLTRGADVYRMGIAVAPVTNWRFYDTIYTERFMRKPQDNPHGYDDNSPINFADQLKGKLLLIHGTADDNVHLQNSMEMVEKLVQDNKQFNLFVYPNKNHSIYGGNTRCHLYTMMTSFIRENL
jgi:dipeptidyl-peptidase 4